MMMVGIYLCSQLCHLAQFYVRDQNMNGEPKYSDHLFAIYEVLNVIYGHNNNNHQAF
jgi:hypothetical protein